MCWPLRVLWDDLCCSEITRLTSVVWNCGQLVEDKTDWQAQASCCFNSYLIPATTSPPPPTPSQVGLRQEILIIVAQKLSTCRFDQKHKVDHCALLKNKLILIFPRRLQWEMCSSIALTHMDGTRGVRLTHHYNIKTLKPF